MNTLLNRQIQKILGSTDVIPKDLWPLFYSINDAYEGFEKDRNLIERSLDLSSTELREVNQKLRKEVEVRKQAEQSVLEREKFLSDIFESIQDGISVLSPDLDIIRVNAAMEKKYANILPLEGKKCYKAYKMRDEKCEKCPSVRALETGKLEMDEVNLTQQNGAKGTFEIFAFPMLDDSGKPTGVVEYIRDVTKRKEAEQKQVKLLEQIIKSNEELTRFAHVMTHDLKSPLRGISTLVTWLKDDHSSELSKEANIKLDLLSNRTQRMHSLIDGLLAYTRLMSTQDKAVPVDTHSVTQNILDSLEVPENIEVVVKKQLPVIECERGKIVLIFQHLIKNAIKYMDKPQGLIEIDFIERPQYWEFSISDNGKGIDEKYYKKIFQMFQTLEHWEIAGSTGIGLPLVKKAVEIHGGRIWVESAVGKGSVFYFTISKDFYNYVSNIISESIDSVLEAEIS